MLSQNRNYLCRVRKKRSPVILEDVLVEDYAAEGKSIARVEGKAVFVTQAVPGDVVDVQLYKNKKDWAEGFALRTKKHSVDRVTPFCDHFGICGGCQWQMLPYPKQLMFKQKQVEDNLRRIAKVQLPEILPIIGCKDPLHYRNKIEYTFTNKKFIPDEVYNSLREKGIPVEEASMQNVAGFHAKGMFDKVVEIDRCYLQAEPTNDIRKAVFSWATEHGVPFYDLKYHTGWLRNIVIRMTTLGEIMVNVVVSEYNDDLKNLLDHLLKRFPEITTLLYTINSKRNDTICDLEPIAYHGKGFIFEKLEEFIFKISPKSFFQTNSKQAETLYRIVREYGELTGTETVYDLYCGTGSIGIFLSKNAARIVGVETVADAIKDANENAVINNIRHASFHCGDVIKVCNDAFFEQYGKADLIVTDPPRAGMHEKLTEKLLEMESPLIVYVSCNPATQARDLALLDAKYTVEKVQPVDMFPQTHHIENIVQLKLRKAR